MVYVALQVLLCHYSVFSSQIDWINYYLNRLAPIYQKQSQQDPLMSQSFDFFFQTKNEYITGHIPNTQKTALEFKEISTNLGLFNIMVVIRSKKWELIAPIFIVIH